MRKTNCEMPSASAKYTSCWIAASTIQLLARPSLPAALPLAKGDLPLPCESVVNPKRPAVGGVILTV